MIKIFNANDRDFSTAGNIIIKPIKCNEIKKKSLNGWYIEVEVPIKYKDYISKDKLCVVKTKSKLNPQAFRIGEEINYTTRKIKFKAEHVMFDAKDYVLLDVRPTNQNGLNALNYINERTDSVSPFTMYSNVENINTAYFIRKNLLEAWTIIEERWGGVFDADNWNISFLTSVGNDNGETIAYGKNMQGFDIFEDWSSVCTKLCPVGYDGLMLPEQFLTSDVQYEKQYTRIIDFQTDLEGEEQTEENLLAELRKKAEAYLEENKVPKVSYTIVSNINGNLEIGDTIKVLHPFVNIFTEVLEYEYNLISEKVVSLTFGNYSRDVKTKFENIKNTIEQVNQAISKQEVVINNQTNLINSLNKNGYVYIDENEILLLDAIPKEKAKNVWRFGLAGIGFSSNGYEGPFEVAITMDGQINANFITTGTMSVSRIEGLANFISETEKQISEIEIEQGNITSRVSSLETTAENLQAQIDGSIQFWNGSEIPTVENYPASEWTTEEAKNNHRADIYTVIEDVDGELKQGKSYRFDKVGDTWQWIELTDNELSAVQALATSKAKVFVTTPTVPYSVGDLWLNNGKLYRCKTAKDSNGSYSSSDWEIAVDYTDDTVAELAKTLANNAQSTADSAVEGVNNITNTQGEAEGKNIHIEDSAEEPFVDIELNGESSQKTRSGKNIFNNTKNFSAVTYNSDNDVWEFNITNRYDHLITKGNLNIEANTDYVLVLDIVENTLTGGMSFYTSNTVWLTDLYINKEQTGIIKKQLHSRDDLESALYDIWFWHDNTITGNFKAKIMLCKGILGTEGDYEQYGVMPSPDYPSEIENLEGNIEFKVEGKNLFNNNFNDYTMPKDYRIYPIKLEKGKVYRFNTTLIGTAVTGIVVGIVKNGTMYSEFSSLLIQSINSSGGINNPSFLVDDTWISPKLVVYATTQTKFEEIFKNYNVQLIKGAEILDYEPYKSQVAYFPLAEGQKLMEGSYLADDGIHHSRKQVIFDGSDDEGWTVNGTNQGYGIVISGIGGIDSAAESADAYCTHLTKDAQAYIYNGTKDNIFSVRGGATSKIYVRFDSSITTVALLREKLAASPIVIEIPLAEPETIPYTEEQQDAWNKIKALMTYKNITNITSDAYAKVTYMRDNGLDVYETKQNAQKRYTETSEKLTEQKMTVDGVITQVSETNKRLTNDYLTAEQVNAELGTTKEDIEIIKQNQVTMTQTSKNLQIAIDTINNEGVSKVKTSMGYTFDDEGFKLNRSNAETGTIIDEAAVKVIDKTGASEQNLLYAGYVKEGNTNYPNYIGQTIVASANMIVQNYLVVPNSRFEEYTNPVLGGKGTGVFEV